MGCIKSSSLRHYAVTPLSRKSGLIQWIEGVVSLFKISNLDLQQYDDKRKKHKDNNDEEEKIWNPATEFQNSLALKTSLRSVFRSNHS